MFTQILAGAIFTPEEFAALIFAFIALCIAFVVGVALFIRSIWRLASNETKAPFDIAVVTIGAAMILLPMADAGADAFRERALERQVAEVLDPISTLPPAPFSAVHPEFSFELNDDSCDVLVARLASDSITDGIVQDEAIAFADAGWDVVEFPTQWVGSLDRSFRADGPDDVSVFLGANGWGRLEYRITNHACANTEFVGDRVVS